MPAAFELDEPCARYGLAERQAVPNRKDRVGRAVDHEQRGAQSVDVRLPQPGHMENSGELRHCRDVELGRQKHQRQKQKAGAMQAAGGLADIHRWPTCAL